MNNDKKTAVIGGVLYIIGTLVGNGHGGLVDS